MKLIRRGILQFRISVDQAVGPWVKCCRRVEEGWRAHRQCRPSPPTSNGTVPSAISTAPGDSTLQRRPVAFSSPRGIARGFVAAGRGGSPVDHPSSSRLTVTREPGSWAGFEMEVLAALLVGERPRHLLLGDLEQVVEVERPDPYGAVHAL